MKRGYLLLLALLSTASCDNSYSTMSVKYRVNFSCHTDIAPFNQTATPGRFLSIRILPQSGQLSVTDPDGHKTTHTLSQQESSSFVMGLGGLIIGKPLFDSNGTAMAAFDLACPECNQERYRLSVDIQGTAKCDNCGNSWNLQNGGFPAETKGKVRTLYRYPVTVAGNTLSVFN